jgi:hypothetical protein
MPYVLGIKCLLDYFLKRPSIYERMTDVHTAAKFQVIWYFRLLYSDFFCSVVQRMFKMEASLDHGS